MDKGIYKKILKLIQEKGTLTFMQIDPPNYNPEQIPKIAKIAADNGISAFAVGGSVGAQGKILEDALISIKDVCDTPTILFPGNIATLSSKADAVYLLSMLNSNDPYWISGAQIASSFPIKKMNLEVIPTSYIIVEPGRAVGWIGRAQPIPRNIPYLAAATCLAGEYMGAKLLLLESGGGAESPAPPEMIKIIKKHTTIPLGVAGGIRTEKNAQDTAAAGADIIQVGTVFENSFSTLGKRVNNIVKAAEKGAKQRK